GRDGADPGPRQHRRVMGQGRLGRWYLEESSIDVLVISEDQMSEEETQIVQENARHWGWEMKYSERRVSKYRAVRKGVIVLHRRQLTILEEIREMDMVWIRVKGS